MTAVLVSAIASGQGKTTATAALARHLRGAGLSVRAFKVGADFLDAMILERASGHPVHVLDLWMVGESECRRLLDDALHSSDAVLIEGVMGLYDGTPSSADLARHFALPGSLTASYFHAYFPSCPDAIAALFKGGEP